MPPQAPLALTKVRTSYVLTIYVAMKDDPPPFHPVTDVDVPSPQYAAGNMHPGFVQHQHPAQHRYPVWWTGDGVDLEASVESMVDR
jgi:hypothetical protein